MPDRPDQTYPDAPASLIARWQRRRARLALAPGEDLPARDADLARLARQITQVPAPLPANASAHARKAHEIRTELCGLSELAALNGLLISHLRKRRAPRQAGALFHRIWAEHGPQMIAELPGRWLISSAITFGDHGRSPAECSLGRELNVLFSLIKLYEFERMAAGFEPTAPRLKTLHAGPLPLGMPPFALVTGGLDVNLLAPIWQRALDEPVLGPLALALLERLNDDPATLFRRLAILRNRRIANRQKAPPA